MGTWRERLAAHLERYDISRAELARRLTRGGISTSRSAVTKWLNEGQDPGVDTFAAICRLTGQSADALLGVARGSTVAVHTGDLALAISGLRESDRVLSDYLSARPSEPTQAATPTPAPDAVEAALAEFKSLPMDESLAQVEDAGRRAREMEKRRKGKTPRDRSK